MSVHVFYNGDADPLLVGCLAPLVRGLREDGRISRYFFVRYWLEGRHVRLRLLPAPGVAALDVCAAVEPSLAAFLSEHPAPPRAPGDRLDDIRYRQLFLAEYDQLRWDARYGPDGKMTLRDNNSVHFDSYEPEYARYGGPAGLELAEWHFEQSSDLVLRILADSSITRTVRLGHSVQLAIAMCLAFLDSDAQVAGFLRRYRDSWERTYRHGWAADHAQYDLAYRRMALRLAELVAKVRSLPRDGWFAHCRQLRLRLAELVTTHGVRLNVRGTTATSTDPGAALPTLLASYLHMTNNRLGITIRQEAYLAHLLRAAVIDIANLRSQE